MNKSFGCSRFVFNHFRALWESEYKDAGKGLSYHSCANALPALKGKLPWLQEVDATSSQKSIRILLILTQGSLPSNPNTRDSNPNRILYKIIRL
ncbi:helix-turn-helix domain-containing protein [Salicibibacter cibi]|uniref:helix-turn-helix domain-containing protein n=1 Tax=Salicibibacter cibi TaxID=2743001 RepID=UPI003CCDA0A5